MRTALQPFHIHAELSRLFCLTVMLTAPVWSQQPKIPTNFPASSTAPAQRFGICTHLARTVHQWSPDLLPMIRSLGVSSIRDEDEWMNVEREKGVYKSDPLFDGAMTRAKQEGLDPLFMIGYGNPLYQNKVDAEAYTKFALWTIEHYKGRIKYFELWSEPDLKDFLQVYGGQWNGKEADGSDSPWIKEFAKFITYSAREIKEKYPDVKLVGCSAIAPAAMRQLKYPEMWENIDIFATHPYPYNVAPEFVLWGGKELDERDGISTADPDHSFASHIRLFREGLARAGRPDMPIWLTEVGYNTAKVKKTGLWQSYNESAQAIYTVRLGIQAVGQGIDRTFFYDFYNDGDDPHEVEHNFGLVRRDYTPKPSFRALQHLCALMPGNTVSKNTDTKIERVSPWRPNDAPQTYSFARPDGSTVIFFWQAGRIYADASEEFVNLSVKVPGLKVMEMGRVVSNEKLAVQNNREADTLRLTELPLGADPVYIILK